MKTFSYLLGLSRDLVGTLTTWQRLRQRLRVPLYRNALYLMMDFASLAAFAMVFWILSARFYSTADVGFAAAALSAVRLIAQLAMLGLDVAIIRFLPASNSGSNSMVNSCLTISGISSVLISLIFVVGLSFWAPALLFLREDPVLLVAFVAVALSFTLISLLGRVFVALRRAGMTLAMDVICQVIKTGSVILLASFFAAYGILASWAIGQIIAIALGLLWILPRIQSGYRPLPSIDTRAAKEMARFSSTNYASTVLWLAPSFIMPLMVIHVLGPEANAYFFIAWSVANAIYAIGRGVSFSLLAEGSHDERQLGRDTRRSLKLNFVFVIPAVVLMLLLGDKVLALFSPAYAENATRLLWLLAVAAIPFTLNSIYFGTRRVEKRMKSVVALTSFAAISTLSLTWVLLPHMGILGAGVAVLSSQCVAAMASLLLWRYQTGRARD